MHKPIVICTTPHTLQRYNTVGDYWEDEHFDHYSISEMPDPIFMAAVLIHELVERYINRDSGITDEEVDKWDMASDNSHLDEPGEHPQSPYHKSHMCADVIERMFIQLSGRSWVEYSNCVDKLSMEYEK